jgi:Flp pilus assembly pilin Flp
MKQSLEMLRLWAESRGLRLWSDERGVETTEIALAIVLFAFVAGGGFFVFGTALADFFRAMAGFFDTTGIPSSWTSLKT